MAKIPALQKLTHMHVRYPKNKGPVNVDGSSDWQ